MNRRGFLKTLAIAAFAGPALLAEQRPKTVIEKSEYIIRQGRQVGSSYLQTMMFCERWFADSVEIAIG